MKAYFNKYDIFSLQSEEDFSRIALQIFRYQYENIAVYRQFVNYLNIDIQKVNHYLQIPFLPIEFFKTHKILDRNLQTDFYFQSSGTTSANLSKHFVADRRLYEKSILHSFCRFFGEASQYVYLGLLPSYLERQNSSLIYMVDFLMKQSGKTENGYFLHNFEELNQILRELEAENRKVVLFGVSYALLDFVEVFPQHLENTIVIETGGMKGRKKEITKNELLKELQTAFQTEKIYSEYSMTELLSQAYSLGNNVYQCPPQMKILIRDAEDPLNYASDSRSGGVNIIDLANLHTCAFISTQDVGRKNADGSFQILGRMDNSDIRGCSLLL
ncbi:MAG: acyl transferase [Flavobacteriaceae bacterium]|jgi:phenylacetate-coenzyme A ligase PaaK-like adenylate-forming protein|nr:acyl transferase [Flavobacteriaceae bacterium]